MAEAAWYHWAIIAWAGCSFVINVLVITLTVFDAIAAGA